MFAGHPWTKHLLKGTYHCTLCHREFPVQQECVYERDGRLFVGGAEPLPNQLCEG